MKGYSLQTLGFAFVLLGSFLFLVGLFDGFFFPNWDGPLFWYSWIYSASFYSGIGFVITGLVSLMTSRNMTTSKETHTARPEDQQPPRRMRLSHLPIGAGIALMAGLVSVAVNTFVARVPLSGSNGFPFAVVTAIPGCFGPGGLLGCVANDPVGLGLDAVFWTSLAFVAVALTELIATRFAQGFGKRVDHRSPKQTI